MQAVTEIFLDIETNWSREITVIGLYSTAGGLVQLVGKEITRKRLLAVLPHSGRLFTYNGHCFDLPCIRQQLNLDLRATYDSHDLRFICQRVGLTGGQKVVEQRIGVRRELEGLDGRDALTLWAAYERGNREALETLLRYNAEDIEGLRHIRRHVSSTGIADF